MHTELSKKSGMTLIELLVAVGLVTLIFGSIIGSFQFMISLVGSSKAQAGALALANERMEFIRSLAYADVGTVAGIPEGIVPQNSTTTLNGVVYRERVLIEYIDAPQDGEGGDDQNGILADYKLAKVEYSWDWRGETKTISLISNIVPQGIETTDGGGTLTVNVFDANVQPVSGASVRVVNTNGTTSIDTTRLTNINGVAMFSGAPARSGYEITVSKTGYSTDGTYTATTSNPNPVTLPVAVIEAEVSTMNFQIDELSDLLVRTISEPSTDSFEDTFTDASSVATTTNVSVGGGEVVLAGAPGSFSATGEAYSVPVTPTTIASWDTAYFDARIPTDTSLLLRVYDTTGGAPVLIGDTDLPGNSAGFSVGSVDLSTLDTSTYTSLALHATLETLDNATSSALLEWSITYTEAEPVLANIPFSLQSSKVIGTDVSLAPIYKYEDSFVTDSGGEAAIEDLEWDVYTVTIDDPAYDVSHACGNIPYALDPGVSDTLTLTLVPASTHSLRVYVEDSNGNPIPNADVTLARSGYNESEVSSSCGGVFFNNTVSSAIDYTLQVEEAGYIDRTITDISISGATSINVVMTSL